MSARRIMEGVGSKCRGRGKMTSGECESDDMELPGLEPE